MVNMKMVLLMAEDSSDGVMESGTSEVGEEVCRKVKEFRS